MASAAKLAASLKGQAAPQAVEAALALSAASNNFVLNRRSQGIIFYQASSYQFCQMYANKAISDTAFMNMQLEALAAAERVLMAEIKAITTIRDPEPAKPTAETKRNEADTRTTLPTPKPDQSSPQAEVVNTTPAADKDKDKDKK